MPWCSLMNMGTPFFISKLKLLYDKYSVDKVWTKIYCHFYFRNYLKGEIFKLVQKKKWLTLQRWKCGKFTISKTSVNWNAAKIVFQEYSLGNITDNYVRKKARLGFIIPAQQKLLNKTKTSNKEKKQQNQNKN